MRDQLGTLVKKYLGNLQEHSDMADAGVLSVSNGLPNGTNGFDGEPGKAHKSHKSHKEKKHKEHKEHKHKKEKKQQ
ncbi:hypothetical protein EB796_001388 [Bugula neritina]|uniref:Uncharacterized protein n=1 Tax=Bugula neritina TaxID=10212 RepID=A0A7J7KQ05_BUGNE|nr:hypothetical protein EB796_001388 [Bugula neritina]